MKRGSVVEFLGQWKTKEFIDEYFDVEGEACSY